MLNHIDSVMDPSPALPDTAQPLGDATVHKREFEIGDGSADAS
ncbi:MAG: hypothetical protein ACIAQ0_08965 [Phycisphaerales bacterium JB058]